MINVFSQCVGSEGSSRHLFGLGDNVSDLVCACLCAYVRFFFFLPIPINNVAITFYKTG